MEKTIDFDLVADLYDSYVKTSFDLDFYKHFCKGYNNILELMCGTGRVSLPLIESGYTLTCVDYAEEMLREFRKKIDCSKHDRIFCQDVCNLDLKDNFDLVLIPFNSFSEITDKELRQKAIRTIFRHLLPKGRFFCTLYNPEYRIKSADGNIKILGKFSMDKEKSLIITYYNTFLENERIITGSQFYEIYDNKNILLEKRYLDIRFSIITKNEMIDAATAEGFSLVDIYGDYQQNPFCNNSMFMNFLFEK